MWDLWNTESSILTHYIAVFPSRLWTSFLKYKMFCYFMCISHEKHVLSDIGTGCKIINMRIPEDDNSVIVFLLGNNDTDHGLVVDDFSDGCWLLFLNINVVKTKEMVTDFRKKFYPACSPCFHSRPNCSNCTPEQVSQDIHWQLTDLWPSRGCCSCEGSSARVFIENTIILIPLFWKCFILVLLNQF